MTPTQVIFTALALTVSLGGLIVSLVVNARKHRAAELQRAEDRGRQEQKMAELEDDIDNAHDKIRTMYGGMSVIEQTQAEQGAQLLSLSDSTKRIEGKLDDLIKMHYKGGHG